MERTHLPLLLSLVDPGVGKPQGHSCPSPAISYVGIVWGSARFSFGSSSNGWVSYSCTCSLPAPWVQPTDSRADARTWDLLITATVPRRAWHRLQPLPAVRNWSGSGAALASGSPENSGRDGWVPPSFPATRGIIKWVHVLGGILSVLGIQKTPWCQ